MLQTLTLTNLPTDVQPPILVTVHLVGEQTGKTITILSKVTFWDDWIRQVETCVLFTQRTWRKADEHFYCHCDEFSKSPEDDSLEVTLHLAPSSGQNVPCIIRNVKVWVFLWFIVVIEDKSYCFWWHHVLSKGRSQDKRFIKVLPPYCKALKKSKVISMYFLSYYGK